MNRVGENNVTTNLTKVGKEKR